MENSKNKVKSGIGDTIFDVFNVVLMILLIIVVLYPILNVIAISLSNAEHVARADIQIFPKGFNMDACQYILKDEQVWRGYANSILYALASAVCTLLFTSMTAYPLTRRDFIGKKFLTVFLTITMFFGGGMIPTYLLMMKMNLINNPLVIIIPGCVSAYNVFVFRTFFRNIPEELGESAKIDGANEFTILFRIILPTSKALLATFGLFAIVGMWNNWFGPMIYFKNPNLYPVQNILREYLYVIDTANLQQRAGSGVGNFNPTFIQQISPKGVRMAIVVVTMFPIMCIYPFFQKYFTKGMLVGSVKG